MRSSDASFTPDHHYLSPAARYRRQRLILRSVVAVLFVTFELWRRRHDTYRQMKPLKKVAAKNDNDSLEPPTVGLISEEPIQRPHSSIVLDDKRMILTVSLGKEAAKRPLVERAYRSARGPGQFKGYFGVVTDAPENRYAKLKEKDDKMFIFKVKEEDILKDIHPKLAVQYFKTLLLKYVSEVPELDSVEYFNYIDFDIVIGENIDGFDAMILDKRIQAQKEYFAANPEATKDIPTIYFFEEIDGATKKEPFHAGQFSFDRNSEHCFRLWGKEIIECFLPHKYTLSDQIAIARVGRALEAGNVTGCKLVTTPRDRYILFPFMKEIESRVTKTFIHITNTFRAAMIPEQAQVEYFADVLNLTAEERMSGESFFAKRVQPLANDLT
ncbi:hypothetical protein ACHAXS_001092 [Conticribra weissflogii]